MATVKKKQHGDTHLQHGHRKIEFSRVRAGVQNFIWVYKIVQKKSTKYCQGLVLLFRSGRAGDTNLRGTVFTRKRISVWTYYAISTGPRKSDYSDAAARTRTNKRVPVRVRLPLVRAYSAHATVKRSTPFSRARRARDELGVDTV
jgi:hypothetical protein